MTLVSLFLCRAECKERESFLWIGFLRFIKNLVWSSETFTLSICKTICPQWDLVVSQPGKSKSWMRYLNNPSRIHSSIKCYYDEYSCYPFKYPLWDLLLFWPFSRAESQDWRKPFRGLVSDAISDRCLSNPPLKILGKEIPHLYPHNYFQRLIFSLH